jgi:hypothetical protein
VQGNGHVGLVADFEPFGKACGWAGIYFLDAQGWRSWGEKDLTHFVVEGELIPPQRGSDQNPGRIPQVSLLVKGVCGNLQRVHAEWF